MIGEGLKDTMKGLGNVRLTVQPIDGEQHFWAECTFSHLSAVCTAPEWNTDRGRHVMKDSRTPIETKLWLKALDLPTLIALVEKAAESFKRNCESIEYARFRGAHTGNEKGTEQREVQP